MRNIENGRSNSEIRNIEIRNKYYNHAEGSCLIMFGKTHVICTASVDEKTPPWLRGTGKGWITAEYGMLPRSTHTRMEREAIKGKVSGRTQEIQRLIGRSLRSVVDLKALGERQIKIDCDVIQADGGTRTASISGAWVALYGAVKNLISSGTLTINPILEQVAGISCGFVENNLLIDLDFNEDSKAEIDANFILTESKGIIEIQATAEKNPISKEKFLELLSLAQNKIEIIFQKQLDATKQS